MRNDVVFPGGIRQTGVAGEAKDAMIERQTSGPEDKKPENVHEIITLFSAGRLTPERAYELYLELNDETEVSKKEMQAILLGREDSKGARERMMRRKGYYNR